ncbi:hypothetical protein IAU60_003417 [Kwoniella sp. DSM 27419]
MHAVLLGASKGIGHGVVTSLLGSGHWEATLLVRKPGLLEQDATLSPYIQSGKLRLVKGDATSEDDVRRCFTAKVDVVVSSIGSLGSMTLKGIKMDQPDVCTRGAIALLRVLATLDGTPPRVVVVSSMGMGENHHDMPRTMQYFYSWLLTKPHQDKIAMEYLFQHASSVLSVPTAKSAIPSTSILSQTQVESVKPGFLPEITFVRPAFFGADAPPRPVDKLKIGEKVAVYSVRRSEVSRFIVDECVSGKSWVNRFPVIGA